MYKNKGDCIEKQNFLLQIANVFGRNCQIGFGQICSGQVVPFGVTKEKTMNKKHIKLYNVLFPLWVLIWFPQTWIVVLPGNFAIDSLVLLFAMLALKMTEKWKFYKKHILPIFGFGMLADLIGSAYMLLFLLITRIDVAMDHPIITVPAIVLSGAMIFVFNYFVTFKKQDKRIRFKLALTYAIATAPYTFLIPFSWLW